MVAFFVIGTRPEAIKLAPVILGMEKRKGARSVICVTGQHGSADAHLSAFGIRADYDLESGKNAEREGRLNSLLSEVIARISPIMAFEKPDAVIVQGDTTSALGGALAAFDLRIPIAHVEAGLRTGDISAPYPEEANRAMIARIASLNFAPDGIAAASLAGERVPGEIHTTGNTVADALELSLKRDPPPASHLPADLGSGRAVVVTAHRRENIGKPLERICRALVRLSSLYPDIKFVFPAHPNPAVSRAVRELLRGRAGIFVTEPLCLYDINRLTRSAFMVMTDSGGLSEEAAVFGVPAVILREKTERTSLVRSGKAVCAGTHEDGIVRAFSRIADSPALYRRMKRAFDPICVRGASHRIVDILIGKYGEGKSGAAVKRKTDCS